MGERTTLSKRDPLSPCRTDVGFSRAVHKINRIVHSGYLGAFCEYCRLRMPVSLLGNCIPGAFEAVKKSIFSRKCSRSRTTISLRETRSTRSPRSRKAQVPPRVKICVQGYALLPAVVELHSYVIRFVLGEIRSDNYRH